jgi:hypothetical protein
LRSHNQFQAIPLMSKFLGKLFSKKHHDKENILNFDDDENNGRPDKSHVRWHPQLGGKSKLRNLSPEMNPYKKITDPKTIRGPRSEPGANFGYNVDDSPTASDGDANRSYISDYPANHRRSRRSRHTRYDDLRSTSPLRQSNHANSSRTYNYRREEEQLRWSEDRIRQLEDRLAHENEKLREAVNDTRRLRREANFWRRQYEAFREDSEHRHRRHKDEIKALKSQINLLTSMQVQSMHPRMDAYPYTSQLMGLSNTATPSSMVGSQMAAEGCGESLVLRTTPTASFVADHMRKPFVSLAQPSDDTADETKNFRTLDENESSGNMFSDESVEIQRSSMRESYSAGSLALFSAHPTPLVNDDGYGTTSDTASTIALPHTTKKLCEIPPKKLRRSLSNSK